MNDLTAARAERNRADVRALMLKRQPFLAGVMNEVIRDSWVEIRDGGMWDTWLSQWGSGRVIGGSGVTFQGTMGGRFVARTADGRMWGRPEIDRGMS